MFSRIPMKIVWMSLASCLGGAVAIMAPCQAQDQAADDEPITQVIVTGSQAKQGENDFVAGKIVIGRKIIAESGKQNVADILRREPAITVGKDGRISLMGMQGYTQVLVDGLPPSVNDPFEMDPSQVERIEIITSATASTGPFGIGGTINIIRRKAASARFSQVTASTSRVAGHGNGSLTWLNNGTAAEAPLSFNFSVVARKGVTPNVGRYAEVSEQGTLPTIRYGGYDGSTSNSYLIGSGEVVYRIGHALDLKAMPEIGQVIVRSESADHRLGPGFEGERTVHDVTKDRMSNQALPFQFSWRAPDESQVEVKHTLNRNTIVSRRSAQVEQRRQSDAYGSTENQERSEINHITDVTYKPALSGKHQLEAGLRYARSSGNISYDRLIDGRADQIVALFGRSSSFARQTLRLFLEDEWQVNKRLALNFGLSTEMQQLEFREGPLQGGMKFHLWAPSLHVVRKLPGETRRRLRLSIARTFQMPSISQYLSRPGISSLAPCLAAGACVPNGPDTPDTTGNYELAPENALGFNASYSHALGTNSELSGEIYYRSITGKIGQEIGVSNVSWAAEPRYVSRPVNLGEADVAGIDLSVRLATRDFWKRAPRLDLTGTVGLAQSHLTGLAGPDNHLAGQSPWRAKLGITYHADAKPLKADVDLSVLPGDWVRDSVSHRIYEGRQVSLNTSLNWKPAAAFRLVVSLDNLVAKKRSRIDQFSLAEGFFTKSTSTSAYRKIGVRAECSF